jgi:hypothetical protein
MKNIISNFVFLMTLFTLIGCDNLPIQPEIDDSTNYSIKPNTLNGEETMSEVVPQSNGFIVNKKVISEDSILPCLNLSQEQSDQIKIAQSWWKPVYNYIHSKWKEELLFLDIVTQQKFKKLNIKTSDTNYRKVVMEFNRTYKLKKDSIDKMMSDSLSRRQNDHYSRGISPILNDEQRYMFWKWVNNPKLTCEFIKP